jgi:hypothetical protein
MPSKSAKQAHLMAAVAHNPAFAKKVGIPTSVGKEFNQADKGKKFREGGVMKSDMKKEMAADKKQDVAMIKKAFKEHDAQEHKGGKGTKIKLAKGGMMKETMGPRTMAKDVEAGSNKLTKFGESAVQKRGHTKGMEERDYKNLGIQSGAKGAKANTQNAAPIKMAKGGSASARADGCATKGKTKGTIISMCGGGKM